MEIDYKFLQERAVNEVEEYFRSHQDPRLTYHTLEHTKGVIKAAVQIAEHYAISAEDLLIIIVAASFHDTGYFVDIDNHEEKSAELADRFLISNQLSETVRQKVRNAILSTRLPQDAPDLLDQIICDADLFHLGSPDFREHSKLLRKELENLRGIDISKMDWMGKDIAFLSAQSYHTDYAHRLLDGQKAKNLDKLKRKFAGNSEANSKDKKHSPDKEPQIKMAKAEKPDKGIETMFRITSANNQRLSDMADNKAHILITVNSIVVSLIVSLLLRRLEDNSNLIIPTFILLMVSLSCVIVSIRSTRPHIPGGKFKPEDLTSQTVNLLFFGNFYQMSLDSYAAGMKMVMNNKDFLYGTLIKDIYAQGVVLGRKYKLIRLAYNIFMWGLITAVLAFIIAIAVVEKL